MPAFTSENLENNAIGATLALMAAAARTAPKAMGIDALEIFALDGAEKQEIADVMKTLAIEGDPSAEKWLRDAGNVEIADALFVIGLKKHAGSAGANCQACGHASCVEFGKAPKISATFRGPTCAFKLVDLGIAIGSAVKAAGILNVDNRIMFRAGAAIMKSQWGAKLSIAFATPLRISGKSPFFDRQV